MEDKDGRITAVTTSSESVGAEPSQNMPTATFYIEKDAAIAAIAKIVDIERHFIYCNVARKKWTSKKRNKNRNSLKTAAATAAEKKIARRALRKVADDLNWNGKEDFFKAVGLVSP